MYYSTWVLPAYRFRERIVGKHHKGTFKSFLAYTRATRVKWINKVRREYLESLRRCEP